MTTDEFVQKYSVERRGTGTLKWDSLEEIFGDADLTALWVADMEFQSPPAVKEAIIKRAEHGAFGYGRVEDSYYEAFAAWQKKRHNMDVSKEDVRFNTGVVGALYAVVNAYTNPNDSVIICPPVYYPFYDAILNTGRKLVTCDLDNKNGKYSLDLVKFEKEISENKVKAFILCSPHNPVSKVWTQEEMTAIFAICRKHDVLVISDEIHQDFIHSGSKFIPASVLNKGEYKDMLITLTSASKTFNLAGLIHSHMVIYDALLREKYDNYIKTVGQAEANVLGLVAVEAAYRGGEEWFDTLLKVIEENYAYAVSEFAKHKPKVTVTPLEGTYLMWIDLSEYVEPEKVAAFTLEKCRIAVDVGEWFSFTGHGFIRINLATDPKFVKLAINNIINNL